MNLTVGESRFDESQADSRLLDTLAEITFVERESQIAVFEHVVSARLVVASSGLFSFHFVSQTRQDKS